MKAAVCWTLWMIQHCQSALEPLRASAVTTKLHNYLFLHTNNRHNIRDKMNFKTQFAIVVKVFDTGSSVSRDNARQPYSCIDRGPKCRWHGLTKAKFSSTEESNNEMIERCLPLSDSAVCRSLHWHQDHHLMEHQQLQMMTSQTPKPAW